MVAIQEVAAQIGRVTGAGIARNLRRHYPRPLLVLMVGLLLGYRLVFTLSFLPQPGFGFAMMQTLWSILCYPLVVGASRFAFDLRKPAPGAR